MSELNFIAQSEQDTARLATALASALSPGDVVALDGTLGAGKTRFVRFLAESAGVRPDEVSSPTFVLVHEYSGVVPIYHFDAYRVRDVDEFESLGVDEYFSRGGWCVVEWAHRVAESLPRDRLSISIAVTGETSRQFTLSSSGRTSAKTVERIRNSMG